MNLFLLSSIVCPFQERKLQPGTNMHRRRGSKRALVALSLLACAPGGWSQQFWSDPFKTLADVPPAPGMEWQPRKALPKVPAPETTPTPTTSAPLSLAELTEYALRNNPRARQAWFAARAAAAGVGIEQADRLPQITGITRSRAFGRFPARPGAVAVADALRPVGHA